MMLRNPKPGTSFHVLNGRLALFHGAADAGEYWRHYWRDSASQSIVQTGHDGELPEIDSALDRWVPKTARVLEAGCGPGHIVSALRARGYDAFGVEYEAEVVARAKQQHPELDLRVGDVRHLDLPDHSIDCYLSLGVVEHFIDGPLDVLREARRVVADDGIALVSVPYLNPLREQHIQHARSASGGTFHQYYFSDREFTAIAAEAGFDVVDRLPYAMEAFVCREHPVYSRVWKSRLMRVRMRDQIRRVFRNPPPRIRDRYSHMILFVCRPRAT